MDGLATRCGRGAFSLLRETMQSHSTPDCAEFQDCDAAPCLWCETARKILDGK